MADKNIRYEHLRRNSESSDDTPTPQFQLDAFSKGCKPSVGSKLSLVFSAALSLISNGLWAW